MKTISFIFVLFLILLPSLVSAIDVIEPESKAWETSPFVGYAKFKDAHEDAAFFGIRTLRRVQYPFLAGVSMAGTITDNFWYAELSLPISLRVTLMDKLKLDAIVAPGMAYAHNRRTSSNKYAGSGTAGLELKYFVKKGLSFGLGGYYTALTESELNHYYLAFIFTF